MKIGIFRKPEQPIYSLPPPGGWMRHLLYYIYPVAGNGVWASNIAQLRERLDLFNGRRIVAIGHQKKIVYPPYGKAPHRVDPPERVKELLGNDVEYIVVQNQPGQGESVAFNSLWSRISDCRGPGDVTAYAHAKGVSYFDPTYHVHNWTRLLYTVNMDYWPLVEQHFLLRHLITGCLRRNNYAGFHYSGNFFWFRNAAMFRREWDKCKLQWGGIEIWPGLVFKFNESGCLFHDEPPEETAYNPSWLDRVLVMFREWSAANASVRRPGAPTEIVSPSVDCPGPTG